MVLPFHPRKIYHLGQGKTKLDPCSLGTPHKTLQISHLLSEFKVLPKWKPFRGTRHVMRTQILKGAEVTSSFRDPHSSQKISGGEMPVNFTTEAKGKPN